MPLGYNGKILMVNLTTREIGVEEPEEKLYRQYLGGTGLGVYYCMRDIPKDCDPLGPDNVLVLSTGVVTGAPVMAASRLSANAKSPVTGGIGDAQGGGFWGVAFKNAGFDAVVISGKAEKPVYLFVQDGKCEIRDAEHIWGMTTKDYETKLREELGREAVVAGIGPAGENQNVYACIINERKHANGRTGMGAVMGSKNLKCVAAIGKKPTYEYSNPDFLREMVRYAGEWAKTSPFFAQFNTYGTNGGILNNNAAGMLPTKNFQEGYFEPTERTLTSVVMNETVSVGIERCYMCNIACKRQVSCNVAEHGWDVDPAYGGPEYETVSCWGPYLLIDDMPTVCKANEICNAMSIDTISSGAAVAFAMDLYENGIITKEQCGMELNFSNRKAAIQLLEEMCARSSWLGNLLADGIEAAAKEIGNGAEYYNMGVKNNPFPAHMPQVKKNLAMHYAVNEHGADHCTCAHDPGFGEGAFQMPAAREHYATALYEPVPYKQMTEDKVKLNYYTHINRAIVNGICVCNFGYGSGSLYNQERMVQIVNAVTGWGTNLWEMMKAGERTIILMRLFNQREGFGAKDDMLPERIMKQPFTEGASAGELVDKEKFIALRDFYYDMAGLDAEGHPRHSKVVEMDLVWAENLL